MHRITALAAALPLLATACQHDPATAGGPAMPAATIDGETISLDELDAYVKEDLFSQRTRGRNPSRMYGIRIAALEKMLTDRAVEMAARRRGVTPEAYVAAEVAARPIADAEIAELYDANPAEVGDRSLEEMTPAIREFLETERETQVRHAARSAADVAVALAVPRVEIAADGPTLGPASARVTIIEFSDFQCPYCQRANPTMKEIAARYPEDVRIVYRQLPIDRLHSRARAAAEASLCADDQDLFWPYHDLLFANGRALSDEDLRRYGAEVGLDAAAFEECVASGRKAPQVERDIEAAQGVGISGTPAFVVNGILVFGLQTLERFDELIQAELDGAS